VVFKDGTASWFDGPNPLSFGETLKEICPNQHESPAKMLEARHGHNQESRRLLEKIKVFRVQRQNEPVARKRGDGLMLKYQVSQAPLRKPHEALGHSPATPARMNAGWYPSPDGTSTVCRDLARESLEFRHFKNTAAIMASKVILNFTARHWGIFMQITRVIDEGKTIDVVVVRYALHDIGN
jgi:hypothetical protein